MANLLMFFSFYLLVPVLPFYVMGELGATESVAGVVLSLYTLSALLIRPFSGFMVDTFARKPLYLICYGLFTAVFAGYLVAATLTLFVVMRVVHGLAFGINSVSGSTLAVDIMPSERRGEGIGYFGMASNIAMALGPMTGLFLYHGYSFEIIFLTSFTSSLLGFATILFIRAPRKICPPNKELLSLDRFVLLGGLPQGLVLATAALGYGIMSNYVGLYSQQMNFGGGAGFFFTLQAVGIVGARLLSARHINRGSVARLIYSGALFLTLGYLLFIIGSSIVLFYIAALCLGLGFGYIAPASQAMIINLAPHNRRGTANSTYYTSWDLGLGLGILLGGRLIESLGFVPLFVVCVVAVLVGALIFKWLSAPYYAAHKLR